MALGYADQARAAESGGPRPGSLGGASSQCGVCGSFVRLLCQCRRDVAATQAHAEPLIALAAAQGYGAPRRQGRILRGWALAMQGEASEGVALIRQGLDSPERGARALPPPLASLLAEAYSEAGQPEAGLTVLDEAFTLVETTEERWWEAELSRLKGVLLLQLPRPEVSRAEASFLQALDVARRQQAKALELRAALSLSPALAASGQAGRRP